MGRRGKPFLRSVAELTFASIILCVTVLYSCVIIVFYHQDTLVRQDNAAKAAKKLSLAENYKIVDIKEDPQDSSQYIIIVRQNYKRYITATTDRNLSREARAFSRTKGTEDFLKSIIIQLIATLILCIAYRKIRAIPNWRKYY